jgi:hypothetical protein
MHAKFWLDNLKTRYQIGDTKIDFKRINLDSIQMLQDKDTWKALLNPVAYLLYP